MSNIIHSFKNMYISQHNSGYLFDLIISKILKSFPNYQQLVFIHIHKYKENIISLQELIFNDSFANIYNNVSKSGKLDLEEVLIQLNKITVSKFEFILLQDLKDKFQQSTERTETIPKIPLSQSGASSKFHVDRDDTEESNSDCPSDEEVVKIQTRSHQFCSDNAVFINGNYLFKISLNKIKSIRLDNFKIKCNIYNINEYNNKFYLMEQNSKILITIPIGYYNLNNLLETITEILNFKSINRTKDYSYRVWTNLVKNKVCIACESPKDNKNILFGLSFGNVPELSNMLGFCKEEYFNNNMYMAESYPDVNIFDELYIRLFINNKEVRRYSSSKQNFYYFEIFDLCMKTAFGKNVIFDYRDTLFEITQDDLDMKDLSIQIYNTHNNIINDTIPFKCIFTFEYEDHGI